MEIDLPGAEITSLVDAFIQGDNMQPMPDYLVTPQIQILCQLYPHYDQICLSIVDVVETISPPALPSATFSMPVLPSGNRADQKATSSGELILNGVIRSDIDGTTIGSGSGRGAGVDGRNES